MILVTRFSFPAALLALLCLSGVAHAGEQDAKTFFAQGRQLRQEGRCQDALVAFRRAQNAYPEGLGSLRNIAECEQELGRPASARRSWWTLRSEVLKSGAKKYSGWDKDAERAYEQLAPLVGRLVIRLTGVGAALVEVSIDGEPIAFELLGIELERDPGNCNIAVRYGDKLVAGKAIEVRSGKREDVELDVSAAGVPAFRTRSDEGASMRTAGWVSLGVGGGAAIGFAVALGVRAAATADLAEICPSYDSGGLCPPSASGPTATGKTASTLVNVFGVTAAIGAAVGATLVVVGFTDSDSPASQPTAAMSLTPLPGGAHTSLTLSF